LNLAKLTIPHAFDQLLAVARMAALQAGGDLEVLLLGGGTGRDHPPDRRRIGRKRLLHEDMNALRDRVFQLLRPETRVAGEHRHITRPQVIDGPAPGVETREPPFGRDIHLRTVGPAQVLVGAGQAVLEEVRHRHQLDRPVGRIEGVGRRPAAASAATDQGQADGVIAPRVYHGDGDPGQCGRSRKLAAPFQNVSTRGPRRLWIRRANVLSHRGFSTLCGP